MEQTRPVSVLWLASTRRRLNYPGTAPNLPPELILKILWHVQDDDHVRGLLNHFGTLPTLFGVPSQATLSNAARVCRMWSAIASEVLYSAPILLSPRALRLFTQTVNKSTALALHVEALNVLKPDSKLKWYDRLQLVRRHRNGVRSRSCDDMKQILNVCTRLHSFSLSNLSTGASRFFQIFPERSAWSSLDPFHFIEMRTLSFHGDGPASFVRMHTAGKFWPFPALTELHVTKLILPGLPSASFPALRRLSIAECIVMTDYSEVLPSHSALLSDVAFVNNYVSAYAGEPSDLFARWPHDALRSITLGMEEWAVSRETDWGLPALSQIENLRIVVPAHPPDVERGVALPLSIRSLIVLKSNSKWIQHICWDPERKDALRHLEDLIAEGLSWKRIHIGGMYANDCQGLYRLCQEAGVQLSLGNADVSTVPFDFLTTTFEGRGRPDYIITYGDHLGLI